MIEQHWKYESCTREDVSSQLSQLRSKIVPDVNADVIEQNLKARIMHERGLGFRTVAAHVRSLQMRPGTVTHVNADMIQQNSNV